MGPDSHGLLMFHMTVAVELFLFTLSCPVHCCNTGPSGNDAASVERNASAAQAADHLLQMCNGAGVSGKPSEI